jgi:D-alanine-D-alanine ligase
MEKIVILHTDVAPDAGEDELDCLRQADTIAEALRTLGYEPVLMPFVLDLGKNIEALRSANPHVVFNLVETLSGRGSLIHIAPALLDFLQMPYTGCRTDAMFLTSNKPMAKKIMHNAGIATPAWITEEGFAAGSTTADTFIVKASWEDASVGLDESSIVRTADKTGILAAIINRKKILSGPCFGEAYIDGREFNIALLARDSGVMLLPPAEMLFLDYPSDKLKLLDYRAKWVEDSFEYDNTRRSLDIPPADAGLIASLQDIALRCWQLFGLRGYARVDFRVDKKGNPFVLEINANPCLSLEAGFAAALERTNVKYHEAIACLINDALMPHCPETDVLNDVVSP